MGDFINDEKILVELVEMFDNHYVNILENSTATGVAPIELGTP